MKSESLKRVYGNLKVPMPTSSQNKSIKWKLEKQLEYNKGMAKRRDLETQLRTAKVQGLKLKFQPAMKVVKPTSDVVGKLGGAFVNATKKVYENYAVYDKLPPPRFVKKRVIKKRTTSFF